MDARTKPAIVQGEEGKFLAKEKLFSVLAFLAKAVAGFACPATRDFRALTKVPGGAGIFILTTDGLIELTPFLTTRHGGRIAILYAPDKHYCWAFFDIRNGKYALDTGLAPH